MRLALLLLVALFSTSAVASQQCRSGEWYSQDYDRCFKKHGQCKQYNHTDKRTCNSSRDNLRCDWDRHSQVCYAERNNGHRDDHRPSQCRRGEWYSSDYNKCFKKNGHCSQYNHTDKRTCNSGRDNMQCDWDRHRDTCYSEGPSIFF